MFFFDSHHGSVLSNLSDFPTWVRIGDRKVVFRTVEAAYQFLKQPEWTLDEAERWKDLNGPEAKAKGRDLKPSEKWDEVKRTYMKALVQRKAEDAADNVRPVLCHRRDLVYWGPWGDRYWGVGKDGEGENELGKIWSELRSELC